MTLNDRRHTQNAHSHPTLTPRHSSAQQWVLSRSAAVGLTVASVIALGGCQQPQQTADEPSRADTEQPQQPPIRHGRVAKPDVVPADVNTASKAAQVVATLPTVENPWTRREIRLHEALYREAWLGRMDDASRPVLLQPMPADELPERLTTDDREFYLRVLAGLHELDVPGVAWTTVEPAVEAEFFPGSRTLATRLSFEILQRNEAEATVIAEVSDRTAHVGASQQRVRATWDGRAWQTERVGARVAW